MDDKTKKISKEKTDNRDFALGKINLILMGVAFVIIVVGFLLMLGSSTAQTFNPDIFSFRRITVGPMISLFGFVMMVVAILWRGKE